MSLKFHHTEHAPAAIGPYSQAVSAGGFLFTAGQVGLDPATGEMVGDDCLSQVVQVMANLRAVLATAGCDFDDVAKTTIFLSDMSDFAVLNEIYGQAMGEHRPARSTVAAAGLPKGALVEIEMVALLPSS